MSPPQLVACVHTDARTHARRLVLHRKVVLFPPPRPSAAAAAARGLLCWLTRAFSPVVTERSRSAHRGGSNGARFKLKFPSHYSPDALRPGEPQFKRSLHSDFPDNRSIYRAPFVRNVRSVSFGKRAPKVPSGTLLPRRDAVVNPFVCCDRRVNRPDSTRSTRRCLLV